MGFVTDKAELKPGLILFRRGDVDHRMWYCRMKIPKGDRYKTVSLKTTDIERRTKVQQTLGIRVLKPIEVKPSEERTVPFISDFTIRIEMSIFGAVMNYAIKKRYVPASQRFDERPKLKTMRRDEFTLEECRKLHTVGRKWIAETDKPSSIWYRTVTYNMILIACNTGMRPAEMKNLRWRDIMPAKDREGREIVVLFVQGKGKSRKLVAPKSVGDYLEPVYDLLSNSLMNAKWIICKLVLSLRSQFFHSLRHFSSQPKDRSTIQRLGNTTRGAYRALTILCRRIVWLKV